MIFKNITILDENFDIRDNQYVGIIGDRIDYIGDTEPYGDYGDVYSGKGRLLMPGFYNVHAHTPMTLLRGYAGGYNFQDWLFKKIIPFEAKLTREDVYYGSMLGIAEMLKFGTVSTTDMYLHTEHMTRAFIDSGVKINTGAGLVSFNPDERLVDNKDYKITKNLYENYHGACDGRIIVDASVHAEYTSLERILREYCEYAVELGLNMQVHMSEMKKEHDECKKRHGGKTPARYFNDIGMFKVPTTAAHCVWIEDEDYDILAENHVTVATCPVSNAKLASGICDAKRILEKNINLAIATDGVSSNNNLNMIEEMKFFSLLQKVRNSDSTAISPKQTIKAATVSGAMAQGRKDCGCIKEGNKADLIVFDIDQPHMKPVHSMLDNIVYSADGSDIEMTICDGKLLYKNGEYYTIDLEKVEYEVEKRRLRVLSEL